MVATTRPADAEATIRWTSSDESVATVDQAGLVTLRAFGTAVITARYRSYSARCTVATLQEPPLDPSAALGAPLSDDIVYSKNVVLYAPRRIMQGFDLTDGGEIYYSQISSDGTSVIVCRAAGPGQDARAEYMTLKYFGHGTQIVAEEASDGKTYIWLNSNASVDSSGEYGDNWSVSRVGIRAGCTLGSRLCRRNILPQQGRAVRPAGRHRLPGPPSRWSVRASPGCVTFGFSTSTRRWLCRSRR
ncbi:MAG: Ig domain-containing protein [Alistipes onderdonkii]